MEQNSHKFKYNFQRTITNIHSNSYLGGEGGGRRPYWENIGPRS